jgi:hypothetical protein
VTVEVAVLSATTGLVPVIVEFAATAAPAVNVTVPPDFVTGETIRRVFTSATVDCIVQTETPPASDIEQASYVFPAPVSVASKSGTIPATGLLFESFNVIVTVESVDPSAVTGDVPVTVEFAEVGSEDENVTIEPVTATGEVNWSVLSSAFVEARVHAELPETSVALQAP